ncbi:MAG: hypothetical protein ACYCW6_30200, partial [Candidatus Xenobia bacterium]
IEYAYAVKWDPEARAESPSLAAIHVFNEKRYNRAILKISNTASRASFNASNFHPRNRLSALGAISIQLSAISTKVVDAPEHRHRARSEEQPSFRLIADC